MLLGAINQILAVTPVTVESFYQSGQHYATRTFSSRVLGAAANGRQPEPNSLVSRRRIQQGNIVPTRASHRLPVPMSDAAAPSSKLGMRRVYLQRLSPQTRLSVGQDISCL